MSKLAKLPTEFGVVAGPISLLIFKQICIDVEWFVIYLALFLLNVVIEFNCVDWWLQWRAESGSCLGRLHHLFSLPFGIFLLIEVQTSIETDALVGTSTSANFITFLSLGAYCILEEMATGST